MEETLQYKYIYIYIYVYIYPLLQNSLTAALA